MNSGELRRLPLDKISSAIGAKICFMASRRDELVQRMRELVEQAKRLQAEHAELVRESERIQKEIEELNRKEGRSRLV